MGCCETRDNKEVNNKLDVMQKYLNHHPLEIQAIKLKIPDWSSLQDQKALEIVEYFNELEKNSEWITVIKDEVFTGKKLPKSKYSSDFIVTRIELDFQILVPLNVLVNHLIVPEQRKEWDSMLNYIQIISGTPYENIIYKKIKLLFYHAEFIDKQIVARSKDQIYLITYSVNDDVSVDTERYMRSFNFFGVFLVYNTSESTKLVLINQTDPKSKGSFLAGTLGLANQRSWINGLKQRIIKILNV